MMTFDEIKTLLALAAARDNRIPSQAMVLAWSEDLGDLDFDIARAAISRHFRESTDYVMPVHIRRLAVDIDRERRRAAREQREAIEAEQQRLALDDRPISDRSAELQALIRATAEKLRTPDANHEKALFVARAMKGRPLPPPKTKSTAKPKRLDYGPPKDHAVAALARQYLADGWTPENLTDRLAISKKWLRKAAAARDSLPPPTPMPAPTIARED